MSTDTQPATSGPRLERGVHGSWSSRRHWVWVVVACVLIGTLAAGYRSIVVAQDAFHLQDWVISYAAGFVRRGLTGELVYWISSWSSMSPVWVVFLLQSAAYGAFLHGAAVLALRGRRSWAVLLAAVSPAVLLFHLYDISGGFRKEILGLALVAQVLARSRRAESDRTRFRVLVAGLLLATPLVLSHELNVVVLPALVPLALEIRWDRRRVLTAGALVACTASAMLLALQNPGSAAHEAGICAHLRATLPSSLHLDVCGEAGAVSWLSVTSAQAFEAVRIYAGRHGDGLLFVLPLITLGLAPLGVEARDQAGPRRWRWAVIGLGTSSLAVFVAASVALDWGRLIYTAATLSFLVFLYLRGAAHRSEAEPKARQWRWIPWVAPAYALAWNLNHANDLVGRGLLRLVLGT